MKPAPHVIVYPCSVGLIVLDLKEKTTEVQSVLCARLWHEMFELNMTREQIALEIEQETRLTEDSIPYQEALLFVDTMMNAFKERGWLVEEISLNVTASPTVH